MPAFARALPPGYVPGRPQDTALYRIVREHLASFLERAESEYQSPLPRYVVDDLEGYLKCGLLEHGFLRCRCDACAHELLVAFACKSRGVCPSCNARRMCNEAAFLTDRVLPSVPVRQWVLSLPYELRRLAAFRADVLTTLGRVFVEEIFRTSGARGAGREGGAVTFVQRFGGSLNLNVHFHTIVLDGAFVRDAGSARFVETPPPSREQIADVARRVHDRATRWLRRKGLLDTPYEDRSNAPDENGALDACARVALRGGGLSVIGERARPESPEPLDDRGPHRFSASHGSFDVHAAVRVEAEDDRGRERLVRYCARPPLALDRLSVSSNGDVLYRVKYPRGRQTHRVMSPVEFLARLAALVPPPRYPLVRYHGVLAPHSAWRKHVVPRPSAEQRAESAVRVCRPCAPTSERAEPAPGPTARGTRPDRRAEREPDVDVGGTTMTVRHWGRLEGGALLARSPRIPWAQLIKRTHGIDTLECPKCDGRLRLLAGIINPDTARAILEALGVREPARPMPAKGPPPPTARGQPRQLTLPWQPG